MRRGIRWIASALAGAMFLCCGSVPVRANEEVKYVEVSDTKEDGTEKTAEEMKEEILAASMALPIETNTLKNWPKGPEIFGEAGIVMDMENGAILYGKSIDKKYYPASITKIMTALVALENSKMDDIVTFSRESLDCQHGGYAHIAMREGEQITMRDALHALMLASANEVAYAIGETVGGTHENFVKMMNDRAKELGCMNTNFMNTNGMFDEKHYVSARDMALISKAAFSKSELLEIVQTLEYTIPPTNVQGEARTFQQKHKMLLQGKYYDSRCTGGKTGYTEKSYNTLVTTFEDSGRSIVVVILASRNDTFENTKLLADYAFQNFEKLSIAEHEKSKKLTEIPETASVTVPKDLDFRKLNYETKENGELQYLYEGNPVGLTVAKLAENPKVEAEEQEEKEKTDAKESGFSTKQKIIFGVGIAVVVLTIVGIIIGVIMARRKKERMRRRREMMRRRRRMEERRKAEEHRRRRDSSEDREVRRERRIRQKDRTPEDDWY